MKIIVYAFLATLSAFAAASDTKSRSPFDYEILTYLWVMTWAAFGGAVNFIRKIREGAVRAFNLTEFIGEIVTSAFVGLLTFYLTEWSEMDKLLSAVMIAVSGHMGSRAIFLLEQVVQRWFEARVKS